MTRIAFIAFALLAGCVTEPAAIRLDAPSALLLPKPYTTLVVEVDFVADRRPSALAIEAAENVLREHAEKVHIDMRNPTPCSYSGIPAVWKPDDLTNVHKHCFDAAAPFTIAADSTAFVYIIYLPGEIEGALGLASVNRAYLAPDPIRRYDPEFEVERIQGAELERSVLVHEIGHILGLVNGAVPMVRDHEHPESPHHSSNPRSVMWPGIDQYDGLLEYLAAGQEVPYFFDADDLADLNEFKRARAAG